MRCLFTCLGAKEFGERRPPCQKFTRSGAARARYNRRAVKLLLENDLFRVEHDAARKLVVARRRALPLDQAFTDETMAQVLAVLRPLRGQRLLTDLRAAPGNNNPGHEAKAQLLRRQFGELFQVRATLVASAVGRLQVLRMARERGETQHAAFLDEAEAIAFLMAQPL